MNERKWRAVNPKSAKINVSSRKSLRRYLTADELFPFHKYNSNIFMNFFIHLYTSQMQLVLELNHKSYSVREKLPRISGKMHQRRKHNENLSKGSQRSIDFHNVKTARSLDLWSSVVTAQPSSGKKNLMAKMSDGSWWLCRLVDWSTEKPIKILGPFFDFLTPSDIKSETHWCRRTEI